MLSFVHFQKYYVPVSHSASSQKPMYRSEGKKYRLTELNPGARPWLSLVFIGCSWILGGAWTAIYLKPLYWSDFDKEHYLICSYLKHGLFFFAVADYGGRWRATLSLLCYTLFDQVRPLTYAGNTSFFSPSLICMLTLRVFSCLDVVAP